jgi:hypothetical protein
MSASESNPRLYVPLGQSVARRFYQLSMPMY